MDDASLDFETLAAHAGLHGRDGDTLSTVAAINPSTTFTYESIEGVHAALGPDPQGYAYSRNANPTVVRLEQAMAGLEGAADVVAFGSGMAAIHTTLIGLGLEGGDTLVATSDLYGGTRGLLAQLADLGITTSFIDICDHQQVEQALVETEARILYCETISNPLLRAPDVARLAELAHAHRALMVIDNTFATPYLFRPMRAGVDVVIYSATKYIAGHGDVMAGLVAGSHSLGTRIREVRTLHGGILSPFEAWLTLRGIRTLPLRMDRHAASALALARWLDQQPWIQRVYYPGLAHHAQHETAKKQLGGRYGGMVSFDLRADQAGALRFIDALRLITPGTSLGDVESLVLYPALSSHRGLTQAERQAVGIGDGLVRLSIGLESVKDLMADLSQAALVLGVSTAVSWAAPLDKL